MSKSTAVRRVGFRLPKNQRLLRAEEYRSVVTRNCKSKDGLFIVYVANNNLQFSRLGVTVSRRVAGRAVERNRIKRTIRESFRHWKEILVGRDVLIIARKKTQKAKTRKLSISLEEHWLKAGQFTDA